ncbi:MAG: site-specific integrase [Candidatus Sericytochromatia bacterium]|nr:site-specific integrase [Candidatus Tanganyikabacteria bacterium]
MKARRGWGEGGIFFDEDRDCWATAISLGKDDRGRRIRKIIRAKTKGRTSAGKREVMDEMNKVQRNAAAHKTAAIDQQALGEFLDGWLENVDKPTIRPSTYLIHESSVRLHIKPTIGDIPVAKLTPEDIQRMHRALEANEVSPRNRQIIHSVLSKALDYAGSRRLIEINPIKLTPRPRAAKPEIKALTPEQATRFLAEVRGQPHETLFVVAVTTAMRQGELFGLQWGDVDLDAGTIIVKRTLQRIHGEIHLGRPKTGKGRRNVPLPELARQALLAHRPGDARPDQWVFTDGAGNPLRKENIARRYLSKRLEAANLPTITFHGLRHTAATLLLYLGEHPKVVQELLGHAEIATTLDIYSHYQESMGRKAASRLNDFFAEKPKGKGRRRA